MAIRYVPVSTLCLFLEAVGAHPHEEIAQLATYAGRSSSTARQAISDLTEIGLVERDSAGRFTATTGQIGRGIKEAQLRQLIRRALFNYRPFSVVCEGIAWGETEDEAIRKSTVLLSISKNNADIFKKLIRWGEELGILNRNTTGQLIISEEFKPDIDQLSIGFPTEQDITSEVRARLYVSSYLGMIINNYIDDVNRSILADALLKATHDPVTAIEDSGRVLENFLRQIAADKSLSKEAQTKNGATQVAMMLRNHDIIHTHHMNLIQAIATIRNSQGHSLDKITGQVWSTESKTAFWAIQGTLITLRSVYEYVHNKQQVI